VFIFGGSMKFQLLQSEIVYPGRAFTIRRDAVRLPDGRETWLDIVEHVGSVVIIPLDAEGNLLFVRQYRHAAGRELLELPAGTLEAGEAPDACALREIREETGMAAGKMDRLGGFFLAPGYSTEYMYVYLATDLYEGPLDADADEFLSVERIPLEEALVRSEKGEMPDAKSLAALMLAHSTLKK
jgi:ADP-ribose pyrophosphatase